MKTAAASLFALSVLGVLLGVVAVGAASESLTVTPTVRDGQMLVSFEVTDGITADLRDGIRSGLSTTFLYDIDVRQSGASVFSRDVASLAAAATVQFDNLTRRYQLSRAFDGRVEEMRQTEDREAMEKWLTRFDRVPVVSTTALEANSEYAVRIRLYRSPRNGWFLLPWNRSDVVGRAKFTFLP